MQVPRPFGRLLTAMVTPFHEDGTLDLDGAVRVAEHLVSAGNEGLVVSGTTGEAPTTTDEEKRALVSAVVGAVGDRAHVIAGVGTNDTAHSVELAHAAAEAGAHGLLAVTPYYSRPTQAGIVAHTVTVADATGLPVMLYDIPARTGVAMTVDTIVELAGHPRIVAMKDARGDVVSATQALRRCDLAWYSGDDAMTLPLVALGGAGLVGVTTHVASDRYVQLLDALDKGDLVVAAAVHRQLQPAVDAVMTRAPGAVTAKAYLCAAGVISSPAVRLPHVRLPEEQQAALHRDVLAALS